MSAGVQVWVVNGRGGGGKLGDRRAKKKRVMGNAKGEDAPEVALQ